MANAKKCDRCGTYYNLYNEKDDSKNTNGFMTLNIDSCGAYVRHQAYDLCPKCNQLLYEWFEAVDIEETHVIFYDENSKYLKGLNEHSRMEDDLK